MFSNRYRYIFIILLAVYSYLNILFTEGDRLFGADLPFPLFFGSLFVIILLIWESNRMIVTLPSNKWRLHPLVVQFGLSIVAVLLISALITLIFPYLSGTESDMQFSFKLALGFAFRVNLFLNSINAIVFFMNRNRLNEIEKELLLKQTAEARFDALRNQVNPHFLFNSLNVLSTLVHKSPETASNFIEQLSIVYRYVLSNQQNNVIHIDKELEFLEAYLYLLKIRFGESIEISNKLTFSGEPHYIAPATLQMLIENAIKHNIISRKKPLAIRLYEHDGYYIVENNLQPKPVKEISTETGLKNIRRRYEYLCNNDALIVQSNGNFVVKVPILESGNEGTDR